METQQDSVFDDISRGGNQNSGGFEEKYDSFDSEVHLVSVENMLSLGELVYCYECHSDCIVKFRNLRIFYFCHFIFYSTW